jgi:hypothetical protein
MAVSFWVKSNKTGTYICEIFDNDNSRSISKSYTISSASTWEKKIINIPADTTGALDNDNNTSLLLTFWLAGGTDYTSGTLQTDWGSLTSSKRAVGQVNLADSTDNEWYVTGVQLEAGTTASDFEFLPVDVNLQRCLRYFENFSETIGYHVFLRGQLNEDTLGSVDIFFKQTMRTEPSVSITDTNVYTTQGLSINKKGFVSFGTLTSSSATARVDGYEADAEL